MELGLPAAVPAANEKSVDSRTEVDTDTNMNFRSFVRCAGLEPLRMPGSKGSQIPVRCGSLEQGPRESTIPYSGNIYIIERERESERERDRERERGSRWGP